jgi:AcrR family transcriptional regulator
MVSIAPLFITLLWHTVNMPRTANPATRMALIEAAARLLAQEGPDALTLRRLAAEVGTSTMAIYTHFGSMEDLHREVRREGFARLAAHLTSVAPTEDPVADLSVTGVAYIINAVENPYLYRTMFSDIDTESGGAPIGIETFEVLAEGVRRCMEARRFRAADPAEVAIQFWSATHGVVMLHLGGLFGAADALRHFAQLGETLLAGLGDKPAARQRSMMSAAERTVALTAAVLKA